MKKLLAFLAIAVICTSCHKEVNGNCFPKKLVSEVVVGVVTSIQIISTSDRQYDMTYTAVQTDSMYCVVNSVISVPLNEELIVKTYDDGTRWLTWPTSRLRFKMTN